MVFAADRCMNGFPVVGSIGVDDIADLPLTMGVEDEVTGGIPLIDVTRCRVVAIGIVVPPIKGRRDHRDVLVLVGIDDAGRDKPVLEEIPKVRPRAHFSRGGRDLIVEGAGEECQGLSGFSHPGGVEVGISIAGEGMSGHARLHCGVARLYPRQSSDWKTSSTPLRLQREGRSAWTWSR
jgi:hypothetical protein